MASQQAVLATQPRGRATSAQSQFLCMPGLQHCHAVSCTSGGGACAQAHHPQPSVGKASGQACLQRSSVMQSTISARMSLPLCCAVSAPCTTTGAMPSSVVAVCLPTVRAFLATAGDPMVVSSSRYPRLPAATAGRKSCRGMQWCQPYTLQCTGNMEDACALLLAGTGHTRSLTGRILLQGGLHLLSNLCYLRRRRPQPTPEVPQGP